MTPLITGPACVVLHRCAQLTNPCSGGAAGVKTAKTTDQTSWTGGAKSEADAIDARSSAQTDLCHYCCLIKHRYLQTMQLVCDQLGARAMCAHG